jgi:molecular chaperone Hsp33
MDRTPRIVKTPDEDSEGDWLRRFHLTEIGVRGAIVRLDASWRRIAGQTDYPQSVRHLLGQSLAASALFAGDVLGQGSVSLQLRGDGPLRMLFAECNEHGQVRGVARVEPPIAQHIDLSKLGARAVLAITVHRTQPQELRYQGIVPLESATLAQAIAHYCHHSEQIPTAVHLSCDEQRCAGMFLQQIAEQGGYAAGGAPLEFERVQALFATLTDVELLELPPQTVLRRLFVEDDVVLGQATALRFGCTCSRERVVEVLRSLGPDPDAAPSDEPTEVRCEFCNQTYRFDAVDLAQAFAADRAAPGPHRSQ